MRLPGSCQLPSSIRRTTRTSPAALRTAANAAASTSCARHVRILIVLAQPNHAPILGPGPDLDKPPWLPPRHRRPPPIDQTVEGVGRSAARGIRRRVETNWPSLPAPRPECIAHPYQPGRRGDRPPAGPTSFHAIRPAALGGSTPAGAGRPSRMDRALSDGLGRGVFHDDHGGSAGQKPAEAATG
jgi:hypothetical protein